MADCCQDKGCEVAAMRGTHVRILWAVLGINAVMFFVEGYYGLLASSTSLLADSPDMLGVLGEAIYKVVVPTIPSGETMGVVGAVALAANLVCFGLLFRYRGDNLILRSAASVLVESVSVLRREAAGSASGDQGERFEPMGAMTKSGGRSGW